LVTKPIQNRGLVGFAALVLVGQQFYRLFLKPMVDYKLQFYECELLVYVVLAVIQFRRT